MPEFATQGRCRCVVIPILASAVDAKKHKLGAMNFRDSVFVMSVIIIACVATYVLLPVYTQYRGQRRALTEMEKRLGFQEAETRALRQEITALRTDPHAIERVAREKFGLCRPNEKIYHFDTLLPQADFPETMP